MSCPYTLLMAMLEEVTKVAGEKQSAAAWWPHATFGHHSLAVSSSESALLAPPVLPCFHLKSLVPLHPTSFVPFIRLLI
jgi:hypothetical protein